jgi:hypothetical protein
MPTGTTPDLACAARTRLATLILSGTPPALDFLSVFAFDGFLGWPRDDGSTWTISAEEIVVVTDDGAEWLTPPREQWVSIPAGGAR